MFHDSNAILLQELKRELKWNAVETKILTYVDSFNNN